MKTQSLILFAVVAAASGWRESPPAPAGLTPGRSSAWSARRGKRLQARYAETAVRCACVPCTARPNSNRQGDGSFTGDGYVLRPAADGLRLDHKGKPEVQGCKA
jgi:hypothetical protein